MGASNGNIKKTSRVLLVILATAFLVAAVPYGWRAAVLHKAKLSARDIVNNFTPDERRNLDAVPTTIVLPPKVLNPDLLETITIGGYEIRVPRPTTRVGTTRSVLLTYSGYDVTIRRPFSLAQSDAAAKQLRFKDTFDQYSAAYHTRPADLDAIQDTALLQRFLLLIGQKTSSALCRCREEFTNGRISGFVLDPAPGDTTTVVEIFNATSHVSLGIWITDHNGLPAEGIHDFLSVFQMKPAQSKAAAASDGPTRSAN